MRLSSVHVPPFLMNLYGPDNPNRVWAIVITVGVIALFPRGSRRAGAIGLIVIAAMISFMWFMRSVMHNFTPQS